MSLFNNNSAQTLNNNQTGQTRYQTRQTTGANTSNNSQSQSSNNIFSTQNNQGNNNIFSNQNNTQNNQGGNNLFSMQNNNIQNNQGSNNLFQNNSQGTANLFGNSGGVRNIFSGGQNASGQQMNQQAQYSNYIKQQQFAKVMMKIVQLANSPSFLKLEIVLQKILQRSNTTMEKAQNQSESLKKEKLEKYVTKSEQIKLRCKKIKEQNNSILVNLLNMKKNIVHRLYEHKVRSPQNEIELQKIRCKIKQTSLRIKQKKEQFYLKKQFNPSSTPSKKKKQKMSSIDRPVMELRSATDVLGKEAMKLKIELEELTRIHRGDA